ncbi:MAG: RNA polymerase sigma factor, partial [Saprospiraceae bacterium]
MTDERIMLNLKTGTLDSAGLLFERHHKVLYSFFLRRTKDREAAADMTQTVFERIIRYRANFKEERAFKP